MYNAEKFLAGTIESCLNQTYPNIEIIIIDDGSKDKSFELAQQYERNSIIIKPNKGKGACAARNYGFQLSSGHFIQFLDADDILSPDKIEKQIHFLLASDNYKNKLIHCQWGRFYNDRLHDVEWWGPDKTIKQNLSPVDWLVANHMSMTGCWLTPRHLIEKGGLWNEELLKNQDGEYFSRLISISDEVLYCDEVKVYYRSDVATSVSKSNSEKSAASVLQSIDLIRNYILSLENSDRAQLAIANKYQEFAFANYIEHQDLATIAARRAEEHGGSNLKMQGGIALKTLSSLFGWKTALDLKKNLTHLKNSE